MRFQYSNTDGRLLFESFLTLPPSTAILIEKPVSASENPYILVQTDPSYRVELASLSDPNIPNGAYIIDADHIPLAVIAADGNIAALVPDIILSPIAKEGHLLISMTRSGKHIADLRYQMNFFYTAK